VGLNCDCFETYNFGGLADKSQVGRGIKDELESYSEEGVMFTTHEVISEKGLEISLPLLAQYGVQLGTRVKVEDGPNGIFVALPITDLQKVDAQLRKA
jgi:hypothetical protein